MSFTDGIFPTATEAEPMESSAQMGEHQTRELSRRTQELLRPMSRLILSLMDDYKFSSLITLINIERKKHQAVLLSEVEIEPMCGSLRLAANKFMQEIDNRLSDQQWLDAS